MNTKQKLRHCFFCGKQIGFYADYTWLDTCGELPCERASREREEAEREEAHERLDRDMGW